MIRQYVDVHEFLKIVEPVLLPEPARNNLILGVGAAIKENPNYYGDDPFMAVCFDEGKVTSIALMTPPYNLLIFSENHGEVDFPEIIQYLQDKSWTVSGVNGERETSSLFAKMWQEFTGDEIVLFMQQRIYELREVNFPVDVSGELRRADLNDFDLVYHWVSAFQSEALTGEGLSASEKMIKTRLQDGNFYFWIVEGSPVSQAAIVRPFYDGISVSYVYTPPELRKNGYASACVAALSQKMLNEGYQYCSLFTDLGNPTSNAIYQKIGYRPVCDSTAWRFKSSNT